MGFVSKSPLPLSEAQVAAMQRLAATRGQSEEDLIAEAINEYLADEAGAGTALERLNDPMPGIPLADILKERGLQS